MGGSSACGGKEVVVVMVKKQGAGGAAARQHKLLATSKTATLEKELNQAGEEGFDDCGQTVFESAMGERLKKRSALPAMRDSSSWA